MRDLHGEKEEVRLGLEIVVVETALVPETLIRHWQLFFYVGVNCNCDVLCRMESPVGMESYPVNSRVQHRSIQCNPRQTREQRQKAPGSFRDNNLNVSTIFPSPSPNSGGQIYQ